ncbi:MAG TPA: hypothetical protein ENN51_04545, partial [candidate division WOR-3 bacterium]|nr:hypothetical protein [candidate division WOR-3 bacterium]
MHGKGIVALVGLLLAATVLAGTSENVLPDGTIPGEVAREYITPPESAFADTDVTYVDITGGTSNNAWPWATSFGNSMRFQMMYLPSEIGRAGLITEFGFMSGNQYQREFYNVTIKMVHTNITAVTTDLNSNYGGNTPDTVFFATSKLVGSGVAGNWDLFTLDNGFMYNGTDNLLVEIVWNGAGSGTSITSRYMSMTPVRRTWVWDWQGNVGVSADASRYNARLGFTDELDDVGVSHIVVPEAIADTGATVTPACSVYNYGTTTVSYDVRTSIGADYNETATVTDHAPGERLFVTFPDWTPAALGSFNVTCSTELTDDADNDNDAETGTVFVRKLDVGVQSLQIPSGMYMPGENITPTATWRNHGNTAVDFEAWVILNDPTDAEAYREKVDVTGLDPGGSMQVGFPSFQLNVPGAWTVRCSTGLAGDVDPANDVLDEGFTVGAVDAGIVAILSPGTFVDTGATVVPSARIRNNSDYAMSFDAWFIISDESDAELYRHSAAVAGLAGGETRDVAWAESWPGPHPEGPYTARCSLAVSDENPANNQLERAFTVGARPPWDEGWVEVAPIPAQAGNRRDMPHRGAWLAIGPDPGGATAIYATKGNKLQN